YGTYRLQVRLDKPQPLTIHFAPALWSSSRIFVDGKQVASFGIVGTSAEKSRGGVGRKIVHVTPATAEFDVIVQVANFEIFLNGIVSPPTFGSLDAINEMRTRTLALDLFVMGTLFIMGLYHICLYVLRTDDRSTVWFGLHCLCVTVYMGSSTEGIFSTFLPSLGFNWTLRIFNMAWIAAVGSFVWFATYVFQGRFSRKVSWIATTFVAAYILLILSTSARVFVDLVNAFHIVTLMLVLYCLKVIVQSCRQRVEGAWIFLAGIMIITFTTVHDVLAVRQIITSPTLTGFGLVGFIFFQSTMIAMRFSKAFSRVKTSEHKIRGLSEELKREHQNVLALNNNLERLVDEKTRDIRTMMEHIPLGVFMITADRRIHKDHSRRLSHIFPQQDPETSEAIDFLFARSTLGSDERNQASACIQGTLGDDALNFETNAHLLPLELKQEFPNGTKYFDLTWNVIENAEAVVDKILVTIRDVTDLRRLQERSRDQQEELEFIGEILRVPSPRFLRFLRSCRDFIQENENLIRSQAIEKRNLEALKLLFVNMHTVKGSARSLYLKKMSQVFHEVEQYYAHLQKHEHAEWDVVKMAKDLSDAKKIVDLYEKIAKEKLGRSADQNGFVDFHMDQIKAIYRKVQTAAHSEKMPAEFQPMLGDIRALFHVKIFKDADSVFQEIFGCLPVLAKDLHKEIPATQLATHDILLTQQAEELFRNIFVHLLPNTMDHGIETAAERQTAGKNPKGTISIVMKKSGDRVHLAYFDDGRGLHLNRIQKIGLTRSLLSEAAAQDRQSVANLIFDSGLSTANHVSDISGRGVGMDAVKRFVESAGGKIQIVLQTNTQSDDAFSAFQFHIELPFNLFDKADEDTLPTLKAVL
ncbi:MAG: ATP-binding protein, partial [Pseudobdellovibrionaceae bacterium]|nr:ATP-binding protein [Pseudobdellovibrionaceae bacterium]